MRVHICKAQKSQRKKQNFLALWSENQFGIEVLETVGSRTLISYKLYLVSGLNYIWVCSTETFSVLRTT